MGIFKEKVIISNLQNKEKFLELELVVDSGATYTQVPSHILEKIGIERKYKRNLKIATGEIIERYAGIVNISIKDETMPTIVIFGDEKSKPILGAVTLEQFGLAIDSINKILVPVPELML